ncbi:hypothetical protein M3Y98_00129300 [Aphelenchoides besseyi]|nr:hypothetical protein M3Y98_00129300 [Aphelenchoides besseyi]
MTSTGPYGLKPSKSSSAIIIPARSGLNGTTFMECFRRLTSKSKKRLMNVGLPPKDPDQSNSSLCIDYKQQSRRFGSTPNVHSCRTEKRTCNQNFNIPYDDIPHSSMLMNQSCYGNLTGVNDQTADYDNATIISARHPMPNNPRYTRKTISEVNFPPVSHPTRPFSPPTTVQWRANPTVRHSCLEPNRFQTLRQIAVQQAKNERLKFSVDNENQRNDTTGVNHSTPQRALVPVANNCPVLDFNLVNAQSNGSESLGTGDTSSENSNSITRPQIQCHEEATCDMSRTSSINGNIHCEYTPSDRNNHTFSDDRRRSYTNDSFKGCNRCAKLEQKYLTEKKERKNLSYKWENLTHTYQLQTLTVETLQKQLEAEKKKKPQIGRWKSQTDKADSGQLEEIRKLEHDLNTEKLRAVRLRSANTSLQSTPTIENLSDSLRTISEKTSELVDLSRDRPKSLIFNHTPKRLFPAKLNSELRHLSSLPPLSSSRSTSTTPDSGAVMQLGSSPTLYKCATEIQTLLFHSEHIVRDAVDMIEQLSKDLMPRIGSTCGLNEYVALLANSEQAHGQDLEEFMLETAKQLRNLLNLLFDLKRQVLANRKPQIEEQCEV